MSVATKELHTVFAESLETLRLSDTLCKAEKLFF